MLNEWKSQIRREKYNDVDYASQAFHIYDLVENIFTLKMFSYQRQSRKTQCLLETSPSLFANELLWHHNSYWSKILFLELIYLKCLTKSQLNIINSSVALGKLFYMSNGTKFV